MTYRYIPVLRWKRGEKRGIKAVPEPMSKDVCPLIIVTPNTFADRKETARREAMPAPEIFADDVYKHWGARPFYLDASDVEPSARGIHPMMVTAKLCRELGAHLIPATTLDASASYDAALLQVAREDKRGVALRIKLREFTSAAQWLPNWPHALPETDLIVDLADQVSTVSDLGSALDSAFRNFHRAKEWRTITIAGTSMLENFKGHNRLGLGKQLSNQIRIEERI
jgi:Beta protein